MSRPSLKPTRTKYPGTTHDTIERHPAYGTIGANRVSGTPGAVLFNSDFRHGHYMTIRIHEADLVRGLSNDWVHGGKTLIEVALSEAQWATFVSSTNMGTGVPCTIDFRATVSEDEAGPVPYIEPLDTRREQFAAEAGEDVAQAIAAMEEALALATTKKQREPIERALGRLKAGTKWVAEQFDEHMEKTVERAKIEVSAYTTQMLQRAGLEALRGGMTLELAEPKEAE